MAYIQTELIDIILFIPDASLQDANKDMSEPFVKVFLQQNPALVPLMPTDISVRLAFDLALIKVRFLLFIVLIWLLKLPT